MLVGILVDVSDSMKSLLQLDTKPTDQNITRIQSIFHTILNIIDREGKFEGNQNIFVEAFGLLDAATCDLLALLDFARQFDVTQSNNFAHENLSRLLIRHGAPFCDGYIRKYLKASEASFFFKFFSENPDELPGIIQRLPYVCRIPVPLIDVGLTLNNLLSNFTPIPNVGQHISQREADAVIEYAQSTIRKHYLPKLQSMVKPQIKSFQSTVNLLKQIAGRTSSSTSLSFTSEQLSSLVTSIEPFIYGSTPMCQALSYAAETFNSSTDPVKVLFLISDGESTDGNPTRFAKQLHENNVIVFSCLLTSTHLSQPRRLIFEPDTRWTEGQRQMFELSSMVENSHSAMSILLEQKWELPAAGHSRLFVQGNHPDVINEYSALIQQIAHKNDALLNIIGRVSLDLYINAANASFEPKRQLGGTCYAHAVAAVLHLAMRRIEGRENGIPAFNEICHKLIDAYGENGAVTENVLSIWAPTYRLRYKKVDEVGARQAINYRRPVVATFRLNEKQWENFGAFYEKSPQGVLESKDIGAQMQSKTEGHAVVLIKCDPTSLTLMNSWGTRFADGGFFRVRNQAVLNLQFYDVFWTVSDLRPSEIKAFTDKCNDKGQDILRNLPESIKNLPYECPRCHRCSPAIQFTGHLLEAECQQCHQRFKPTVFGLFFIETHR